MYIAAPEKESVHLSQRDSLMRYGKQNSKQLIKISTFSVAAYGFY